VTGRPDDRPLDHVERPALPWRPARLTECGLPVESFPTIDREAFQARLRELGQQRSGLLTCMTCFDTARRWPAFEDDPVGALGRETYQGRRGGDGFRNELLAIAALIAAHRQEFAELLEAIGGTVNLAERRWATRHRMGTRRS
jgi:hypothetical protein